LSLRRCGHLQKELAANSQLGRKQRKLCAESLTSSRRASFSETGAMMRMNRVGRRTLICMAAIAGVLPLWKLLGARAADWAVVISIR
jgi:hypothetical protein